MMLFSPRLRDVVAITSASALIIFGTTSISFALIHQDHAPMQSPRANPTIVIPPTEITLPPSEPVNIRMPSIGVSSSVTTTGLNADGSPMAPDGPDVDKAEWLTTSASPGSAGTSVIIGHVDTITSGPSVFFNLGKLEPGQRIDIKRADTHTVVYTVTAVRSFPKDNFPSDTVYRNASGSELRLITCGGIWNAEQKEYTDNIVVFAVLSKAL